MLAPREPPPPGPALRQFPSHTHPKQTEVRRVLSHCESNHRLQEQPLAMQSWWRRDPGRGVPSAAPHPMNKPCCSSAPQGLSTQPPALAALCRGTCPEHPCSTLGTPVLTAPQLPSPAPSHRGLGDSHCLAQPAGSCALCSQLPASWPCSGQRDSTAPGFPLPWRSGSSTALAQSSLMTAVSPQLPPVSLKPHPFQGRRWDVNSVLREVDSPAGPAAHSLLQTLGTWGTWGTGHRPAFLGL